MKILITFSVILLTLWELDSVLSEHPTCRKYDFNDPLTLSETQDCTALPELGGSTPLVVEAYSDSTKFSPFRPGSEFFLTTDKDVHYDITQCISTRALFRGNFASFSFRIGINLQNNNNTDEYNNVQLFVSNTTAVQGFQINTDASGWQSYEKDYSFPTLGAFDDSVIGLRVRIGKNSNLAVEYIQFYDPQITDENCVPLTTPEITTETITTESESITRETDTTETEPIATETDTTESEPITTETDTTETEPITTETDTTESEPIPSETDTTETESITTETDTSETESITTESQTPTTTTIPEAPACLEVDFNNPTSLLGNFTTCYREYLPELIIKPYSDSTITPYRTTSTFYLTNKWEGYSCLETVQIFSLTETNYIESAIFLNGVWDGAWIEISIVDANTGNGEVLTSLERQNNWILISEEVKGQYSDAKIFIRTNMNAYSQLAVEYLNIRGDSC